MTIQAHVSILKLTDDDPKTLGVSHLTADVVTCEQGLVENADFSIDRTRGTIRRLKPFGRTMYTFVCRYDDRSEVTAAEEAARLSDYDQARNAISNLQTYVDLASPTSVQTTAVVKLLCRVSIVLIKRALGVS